MFRAMSTEWGYASGKQGVFPGLLSGEAGRAAGRGAVSPVSCDPFGCPASVDGDGVSNDRLVSGVVPAGRRAR